MSEPYINETQFKAEVEKCLQCKAKPCMQACPVRCSPCDFIALAKKGNFTEAANEILRQNPLGEVCGLVCPDKFCVKACTRAKIDAAIKIPAIQAFIMRKSREVSPESMPYNGKKIAVIGLGPAGIGAVAEALKRGFAVEAFEKEETIGGALNLIPRNRLPREVLIEEWKRISKNSQLTAHFAHKIEDYRMLSEQGFAAVIVALGEQKSRRLGIKGEQLAIDYTEYLKNPQKYAVSGHVIIIGGGAAAVDCALTAVRQGAKHTEMLVRRGLSNMRITTAERESLLKSEVDITTMTRPLEVEKSGNLLAVYTCKTKFDDTGKLVDEENTQTKRENIELVVTALGSERAEEPTDEKNVIYVGDFINGGSTAVQAIASGKNAVVEIAERLKI